MARASERKPNIRVFLDIRGFSGNPSRITELLGIEPDESWSKGDIVPAKFVSGRVIYDKSKSIKRKYSCWTIRASLKKYSFNMEDYIKDIIKKIAPVRNKFKKLPKSVNLMLCVWIDIYSPKESAPSLGLSIETMKFLSSINATLDIDISFVLSDRLQAVFK
ncbi:MAG: DUF4279 domain-containing protein [Nitrospirae bacterium]|nr:DUF4279 domain-containing protein [Nitrospirota bacterium]